MRIDWKFWIWYNIVTIKESNGNGRKHYQRVYRFCILREYWKLFMIRIYRREIQKNGGVVQQEDAADSKSVSCGFDSHLRHQYATVVELAYAWDLKSHGEILTSSSLVSSTNSHLGDLAESCLPFFWQIGIDGWRWDRPHYGRVKKWLSYRYHNPSVVGSNPTPATNESA